MPELPDVEIYKQYLDSTGMQKKISDADIEDSQVLGNIGPDMLKSAVKGRKFVNIIRRGKNLFTKMDDGNYLHFHFGMTGYFKYFQKEGDEKHGRVIFEYDDGGRLIYVSQRKLGKIDLINDPEEYAEKNNIGPDALNLTESKFKDLLNTKRGALKTALMDQELMSGIGNVYSDEIMYQARIHPKSDVPSLPDDKLDDLYDAVQNSLNTAINKNVNIDDFPDDFLLPNREEGAKCPVCGGEINTIKFSGRRGFYCPGCQKKYS